MARVLVIFLPLKTFNPAASGEDLFEADSEIERLVGADVGDAGAGEGTAADAFQNGGFGEAQAAVGGIFFPSRKGIAPGKLVSAALLFGLAALAAAAVGAVSLRGRGYGFPKN